MYITLPFLVNQVLITYHLKYVSESDFGNMILLVQYTIFCNMYYNKVYGPAWQSFFFFKVAT